jgi:hypothetical protein
MKPRHFWWLYEWKSKGKRGKRRGGGLTSAEKNRLKNWMDQVNNVTPPATD